MPTYEYVCSSCGNAWEELQKITDAPVEICPSCAKATAKRQISGGSFILKGGGWYADLYSSTKPKGSSGGETKTEAKSDVKSEAKTETTTKKDGGSGSSSPAASGSGSSGSSSSGSATGGSTASSATH